MRNIFWMILFSMALGCSGHAADGALHQALIQQGVPDAAAAEALLKYDTFKDRIQNPKYFVVVDMTQSSAQNRFYIVDTASGEVQAIAVAHGAGSDPQNTGYAQYFSNAPDTHMTSLGAYLIQEKYVGKHGPSLRLDGLEETNNNVRDRAIVLHPAAYVSNDAQKEQGLSWGCPAVAQVSMDTILQRLEGGAFMYIYGINKLDTRLEAASLAKWSKIPKSQWPSEE